jgi:hypothetical protein
MSCSLCKYSAIYINENSHIKEHIGINLSECTKKLENNLQINAIVIVLDCSFKNVCKTIQGGVFP